MKKYLVVSMLAAISLAGASCNRLHADSQGTEVLPQVQSQTIEFSQDNPMPASLSAESILPGLNDDLNQAEADGLLFMFEEEKLAYDLYIAFYEEWGLPVFQNIASGELIHKNAVASLLEKFGLPDPSESKPAGVFTNTMLQDLYNQLLSKGKQSVSNALKVGASVEEIDILNLQERLLQTDEPDIIRVYENLELGSRNHLRSFVSVLQNQTGEVYQPGYLSTEDYQQIISGTLETGGQGQPRGNGPGGPRNK
ncbi:MAG TPA: DUF2202 domain-containing protein [Pelolinea sp.]|nr:DUF2202 domain-containing protein [Pelolinea sp.]